MTALTNLDLRGCEQLKKLPPQIGQLTALTKLFLMECKQLKELPPQIGQLLALTNLSLFRCNQLILAPGAQEGQPAQTIVAAYAPLLIVEPRKDAPGELHPFLRANPPAVPAFFKTILTDAAHAAWLGEAVKATPELANVTDASGRRAVNVAHETCRKRMLESSWLCKRYELQPGPPEHRSATSVVIRADDHAVVLLVEASQSPGVRLLAVHPLTGNRIVIKPGLVGLSRLRAGLQVGGRVNVRHAKLDP